MTSRGQRTGSEQGVLNEQRNANSGARCHGCPAHPGLVAAAMDPLPECCVGTLVAAHVLHGDTGRVSVAQEALESLHNVCVPAEDVGFVYEKIEQVVPSVLLGAPPRSVPPAFEFSPVGTCCTECERPFDGHARKVPLSVHTMEVAPEHAYCVEKHCSRCDLYYLGHWRYRRRDRRHHQHPVHDVRLAWGLGDASFFALPTRGGQRTHGLSIKALRLVNGVLHRARGPFRAAANIFADMAGTNQAVGTGDDNAHKYFEAVWFAFALIGLCGPADLGEVTWDRYLPAHSGVSDDMDDWLWRLRPRIRRKFVKKWLFDHVSQCPRCQACFGLGLDGKRGMKRFLCACLEGESRDVPEVGVRIQQGCYRAACFGSLYCKAHASLREVDEESDGEEDGAFLILGHRQVEGGGTEYRVQHMDPAGSESVSWANAEDVTPRHKKAYETSRLPRAERRQGGKKKRRAATAMDQGEGLGSDVMAEDEDDKGECGIDKGKQAGVDPRKWKRRRLGGIIAAVTGCRIVVDFEEHQGGEGTSNVYMLLAQLVADMARGSSGGAPMRLPDVVFFDNACALRRYALNPKRSNRTETTKSLAGLKYMLDIWHVRNHTACLRDPALRRVLDPRAPENEGVRRLVDTEACEQAFSFVDRISYVGQNMGPGRFAAYTYFILDLENASLHRGP